MMGVNDGVWDWNLFEDCFFVLLCWCSIVGFDVDVVVDWVQYWMDFVYVEDCEWFLCMLEVYFEGKFEYFEVEYCIEYSDGNYCWVLSCGFVICEDEEMVLYCMVGLFIDIIDCKCIEDQFFYVVLYDLLIGLLNCVFFFDCFEYVIVCYECYFEMIFVVFFFDLDWFKNVNDSFGYVVGDWFFVFIGCCFELLLWFFDCVVCFGGDEFVIFVDDFD